MGTKFCNLNLRGVGLPISKEWADSALECAPGWTTMTSPRFQWGHTQPYAKELSAKLRIPVLCTEYYDDDYAEFSLYEEGKRSARHVPATYEGLRRTMGNPSKFLSAFGLNALDAPILEKLFAVKEPEQAVCLIESFFGCPIWGVDENCLPIGAPDPNTARDFVGANCPVRYAAEKRKIKTDRPPYLGGELGKPPYPLESTFQKVEDTVFCWGGDLNYILKVLRRWVADLQAALLEVERWNIPDYAWVMEDYRRQLDMMHFRVFQQGNCAVLKGVPICNVDVDLPDLARDFRCLTAATRIVAENNKEECQRFDCGFAYGKKLLCFGRRGEYPNVMPDFTLESPWVNLKPKELISAFETPAYWDAVRSVGNLLGFPLWTMTLDPGWKCTEDTPHLQVFTK